MTSSNSSVTGIELDSWDARILPLPKGFSRGAAFGFCGGYPVGRAEHVRSGAVGCWWPEENPELLTFEKKKSLATGRASGNIIPGHFRIEKSENLSPLAWRFTPRGLEASPLAADSYRTAFASATGGGLIIGVGTPAARTSASIDDDGLAWAEDESPRKVGSGQISLVATDGTRVGGNIGRHAVYWPVSGAEPVDLSPLKMPISQVQSFDDEYQIGIAWKGMRARAALWKGSAESFIDLTPKGFETSSAYSGRQGYQVGSVRPKDLTRSETPGYDNRAVLWQGDSNHWFDLNGLLEPKGYNASVAWAIEVIDGKLHICGEALKYEVGNPGTPSESHFLPVAHPVLWTAHLA